MDSYGLEWREQKQCDQTCECNGWSQKARSSPLLTVTCQRWVNRDVSLSLDGVTTRLTRQALRGDGAVDIVMPHSRHGCHGCYQVIDQLMVAASCCQRTDVIASQNDDNKILKSFWHMRFLFLHREMTCNWFIAIPLLLMLIKDSIVLHSECRRLCFGK